MPSYRKTITEHLASHVDFRLAGREPLERFFAEEALDAVLRNPSSSEALVERVLTAGGRRNIAIGRMIDVLTSHVLSASQRAWFFEHETRVAAWVGFLETQTVSDDDITNIVALRINKTVATYLVEHHQHFQLRERADFAAILNEAEPLVRLSWLAASQPGQFDQYATTWVHEALGDKSGASWNTRNVLRLLIEQRTDLLGDLLELGSLPFNQAAAGSRHLVSEAHQRLAVGLHEHSSFASWIAKYAYALLALVNNPRCTQGVLDEIAVRFGLTGTPVLLSDEVSRDVARSISRRQAAGERQATIVGEYDEVTDPDALAWLSRRCFARDGAGVSPRPYDARVLAKNPNLDEVTRDTLLRESEDWLVLLADDLTQSQPTIRLTCEIVARSQQRCSGTCADGCHELSGCQQLAVDGETMSAITVADLERRLSLDSMMGRAWVQSSPTDEWLVRELGVDPNNYRTFLGLIDGWTLSVGELIETALSLAVGANL